MLVGNYKWLLFTIRFVLVLFAVVVGSHFGVHSRRSEESNTVYVPLPSVSSHSAVLDLNSALLFILDDGTHGVLQFKIIRRNSAIYEISAFSPEESNKLVEIQRREGVVSLASRLLKWRNSQNIVMNETSLHWLPPSSVFFSEEIHSVALIPSSEIESYIAAKYNNILWIPAEIPQM